MKTNKIFEQSYSQEAIYLLDDGYDTRIRFQRNWSIEDSKWGDWYIENEHEIDPIPEFIDEEYIDFVNRCLKILKKIDKKR